jgi:hypothetical protein
MLVTIVGTFSMSVCTVDLSSKVPDLTITVRRDYLQIWYANRWPSMYLFNLKVGTCYATNPTASGSCARYLDANLQN